jgi:hypothetical protein
MLWQDEILLTHAGITRTGWQRVRPARSKRLAKHGCRGTPIRFAEHSFVQGRDPVEIGPMRCAAFAVEHSLRAAMAWKNCLDPRDPWMMREQP